MHDRLRRMRRLARGVVAWLVFSLAWQPLAAWASTDIANVPMAVANAVKPNVMLVLDSSGGMDVDVLLPTYNSMYYESTVTPGNNPNNLNGMFYLFPLQPHLNIGGGVYMLGDANNPDPLAWRARDAQYNPQYYNPFKTYTPWPGVDSSGNAFANASPTAALIDPYNPSAGSVNLTQTQTFQAWSWKTNSSYASSLYPATYFWWTDTNGNGAMDANEGVRYTLTNDSNINPLTGRTDAQELQNFANWFQYNRTVMLSLKGSLLRLIDTLGGANVGLTDLQHAALTPTLGVKDMATAANVTALKQQVAAISPNLSNWAQPFHERIYSLVRYYSQTGSGAPIQYACQHNFGMLMTPGYLNEQSPWTNPFTNVTPPDPGNADGAAGAPYQDNYASTLADMAWWAYHQNLRTDLAPGQVQFPAWTHETNTNPHLTLYAYAPGAVPVLGGAPYNYNPMTVNVFNPSYYNSSGQFPWVQPSFVGQSTIDDLWHAAVNAAGVFINTTDPYTGMNAIFSDALARAGAAASVTVSNVNVMGGDNYSYATSYNSGNWTGDLVSNPISLTTGAPDPTTLAWSAGSAQTQLDAKPWGQRLFATYSGSAGIPFQWASLSSAQQGLLNTPVSPPGTNDGSTVLNYLRGDRSLEGGSYRTRAHVLGDLVNAEPVIVRPPFYNYQDNGYAAFAAAQANRARMIYQGGNDGMLHAFNAATGAEAWNYVPGLLFNTKLSGYSNTSNLVNLSLKSGFSHQYYVDATPVAGDVDFSYTSGNNLSNPPSPNWHSILVGGLGKGGRGFYALDITNPAAASDSDVAAKVLWEFPNSSTSSTVAANVGYSFGKPVIAKTAAYGWVVLVTSGYNNGSDTGGDGQGHLYVLNAATGALLKDIPTGAGTSSNPAGLAQIAAYADNGSVDDTVNYVYGGDLLGNVWRWDLTNSNASKWTVSNLATLVDASGAAQPVTTTPELANFNGKHMVFVGTGQYLGNSDVPGSGQNSHATQTQSMYGLYDNLGATPTITNLRAGSLVQQTFTTSGNTRLASGNPVDLTTKYGWYIDLPDSGERVVTDPALVAGALVFTSNEPNGSNACQPGGSSWFYTLDYRTGGVLSSMGATPSPVVAWSGQFLGNTLASRPLVIKLPSGQLVALVRQSNANTATVQVPVPASAYGGRHVSWREIIYR